VELERFSSSFLLFGGLLFVLLVPCISSFCCITLFQTFFLYPTFLIHHGTRNPCCHKPHCVWEFVWTSLLRCFSKQIQIVQMRREWMLQRIHFQAQFGRPLQRTSPRKETARLSVLWMWKIFPSTCSPFDSYKNSHRRKALCLFLWRVWKEMESEECLEATHEISHWREALRLLCWRLWQVIFHFQQLQETRSYSWTTKRSNQSSSSPILQEERKSWLCRWGTLQRVDQETLQQSGRSCPNASVTTGSDTRATSCARGSVGDEDCWRSYGGPRESRHWSQKDDSWLHPQLNPSTSLPVFVPPPVPPLVPPYCYCYPPHTTPISVPPICINPVPPVCICICIAKYSTCS